MNTFYLILVIVAFIVFDRIVRHKPRGEAKDANSPFIKNDDQGNKS